MIYGLNFNRTPIPKPHPFAERLGRTFRAVGWNSGCTWVLQGMCHTKSELEQMIAQKIALTVADTTHFGLQTMRTLTKVVQLRAFLIQRREPF